MSTFRFELNKKGVMDRAHKMQSRGRRILKNAIVSGANERVPFQSGDLSRSADPSIDTDDPFLIYDEPYARYQWGGKVMVGRAPKTVTNESLNYDTSGHPLAGDRWVEKWAKAEGKAQLAEAAKAIKEEF